MKSVVALWQACLREAGELHQVHVQRDMAYAMSRIEHEGLSFLTITLPAFEKDFLSALALGRVTSDHFLSFKKKGGLPAFLSGFLRCVFDTAGYIREDADPSVVRSLRQILLLVSKIELPTTPSRERDAVEAYVSTDVEVGRVEIDPDLLDRFSKWSRHMLGSYFSRIEKRIWSEPLPVRHSSGALATRESYNSRFGFSTYTERLHRIFPFWEVVTPSWRELVDGVDISMLPPELEPPVRVALVPKTMKGPRIIAMEPVWMQFVQQGLLSVFTDELRRDGDLAARCGWLDQEPNRRLARRGSIDGSFATIDLSEASDRVSVQVVRTLLGSAKYLLSAVMAARSERAELPDGRIIALNKFASMGSSMCFPIESLVFQVLVRMAIGESEGELRPSKRSSRFSRESRVFGDDLIVPEDSAPHLVRLLEAFGLKVNLNKSFTTGRFRESCGSDWFRGYDVSVFKLRSPFPTKARQPSLERAIDFHNRAFSHGWFSTAEFVAKWLLTTDYIPYGPPQEGSSYLWTYGKPTRQRWNRNLQRLETQSLVFKKRKPLDPLDGYGALKKFFQPHGDEPREVDHLQRDGRSQPVGVTVGWTAIA